MYFVFREIKSHLEENVNVFGLIWAGLLVVQFKMSITLKNTENQNNKKKENFHQINAQRCL